MNINDERFTQLNDIKCYTFLENLPNGTNTIDHSVPDPDRVILSILYLLEFIAENIKAVKLVAHQLNC